jgi:glycosyltransferase involved in cell wall biosynthesis
VISAALNASASIERLYESLAKQTYKDFEWTVADGASTDGTTELLQSFAGRSPWIRFSSEPDFGVYDALNKAIRASSGQYYLVAGADDVLAPDALANFAAVVDANATDVVLANVIVAGTVRGGFYPSRAWIGTSRVFASPHSCGMLFRKKLHENFGYYSLRFPLLADVFFLKTLLRSRSARFQSATFVSGTFAEGGLTTVNKLQVLAENWQIQMLTEPAPLLQTVLFFGKVIVRFPALLKDIKSVRQPWLQGNNVTRHGFPGCNKL